MNRILSALLLILAWGAGASAQTIPKWELFGGFSEYLAGGEVGEGVLPTHGPEVDLDRVVTSYFRVAGQFNAQFADHVVDLAPLAPGAGHVNGKELLGLFGPEATYRRLKRFDLFSHYLIGFAYGRDNHFPQIPTAHYLTWAYGVGGGVDLKLARRVSIRFGGIGSPPISPCRLRQVPLAKKPRTTGASPPASSSGSATDLPASLNVFRGLERSCIAKAGTPIPRFSSCV